MNGTVPPPQQTGNAMNAFIAMSVSKDVHRIRAIASRLKGLVRRLEKFNFPLVAQPLAGLLTRPENHTATARFEALIHLAALTCRGTLAPAQQQLREWLNGIIFQDSITELEDPVEDVFVSNVATGFGNARLFQGQWPDNDHYVQTCLNALSRIKDQPWTTAVQKHIIAMLRVSEAVAERARVIRNTLTESQPHQRVKIISSTVEPSAAHVTFSQADIFKMGVSPRDLDPFIFERAHAAVLAEETLGHTALERRPFVRFNGQTIVALPTAIGAAIRRFVIERASEADALKALQSSIAKEQISNVYLLGCPAWHIDLTNAPEPTGTEDVMDFGGTFDDGSYVHLIFVPDDLAETAKGGLEGIHSLEGVIDERVDEHAAALANKPDYRRGLTLLVHGGIGRGLSAGFGDPPTGWRRLVLPISDFMRLGWDSELTALRAWKLLEQEDMLREQGVCISNINGFPNYYEFRHEQGFEIFPENKTFDLIQLSTVFTVSLRHRLRIALDEHATIAPDRKSWVKVQRKTSSAFFRETQNLPIYFSPHHTAQDKLLACVETSARPWWVNCDERPDTEQHRSIALKIWELTLHWLVRLAPLLEKRLPTLPPTSIAYCLLFPDIERFTGDFALVEGPLSAPSVEVCAGKVLIGCSPCYLRNFANAKNVGERLMLAALVQGAHKLCGVPVPEEATVGELVQAVVRSDEARFIHIMPATTPQKVLYNAVPLPKPRFQSPEDRAWSRLGLANEAGWTSQPGSIPEDRAPTILNQAVDAVWKRIKARLLTLDRVSVIERSLSNFEAIRKERQQWHIAAAALLAICEDTGDVIQTANKQEGQRNVAGLASRVIAEMALCTSPLRGGLACTGVDLDFLIGEVATLIEFAGQSDALHFDLAAHQPTVHANGSFSFGLSIDELLGPYWDAQGERAFREAAVNYGTAFVRGGKSGGADVDFDAAFTTEFGLSIEQYGKFVGRFTTEAFERRTAGLRLPRNEVVRRFEKVGAPDPERAFEAFALAPRPKWDEDKPENANKRDWYPWRYNRRLSITRRPLVQLSTEKDPDVLVMPTLLERTLHYLCQALSSGLPASLFDSDEMKSWIGSAADRNGHDFNCKVAERLDKLHWEVRREVNLTCLGGSNLGDIDVLAWRPDTGVVYVIECKRLLVDRTIGEIGERLTEYTTLAETGGRTPIQKHLDRISYLESSRNQLAQLTNIPVERLQLCSVLVTDKLVPMQFSERVLKKLDLVTDYALLDKAFG